MKTSIYTSAFNLIKHGFVGWKESLKLSSKFADEVVVCVNTSEDETATEITNLGLPNLKLVMSNFSYDDPLLDGRIKDTALQNCSGDVLIQLDMDEYIPESQFKMWRLYAEHLLANKDADCYMVPSLNIYKDWPYYKDISAKWYMHKRGFCRGPVGFARKPDGTVDTNKSDTCELIDAYGNLTRSVMLPNQLQDLKDGSIFVVHFGYLDLKSRVERNQKFWHEHWEKESGGAPPPHKVHMNLEEFKEDKYFEHTLSLK